MINASWDRKRHFLSLGWIAMRLLVVTLSIALHAYYNNSQKGVCYCKGLHCYVYKFSTTSAFWFMHYGLLVCVCVCVCGV